MGELDRLEEKMLALAEPLEEGSVGGEKLSGLGDSSHELLKLRLIFTMSIEELEEWRASSESVPCVPIDEAGKDVPALSET